MTRRTRRCSKTWRRRARNSRLSRSDPLRSRSERRSAQASAARPATAHGTPDGRTRGRRSQVRIGRGRRLETEDHTRRTRRHSKTSQWRATNNRRPKGDPRGLGFVRTSKLEPPTRWWATDISIPRACVPQTSPKTHKGQTRRASLARSSRVVNQVKEKNVDDSKTVEGTKPQAESETHEERASEQSARRLSVRSEVYGGEVGGNGGTGMEREGASPRLRAARPNIELIWCSIPDE